MSTKQWKPFPWDECPDCGISAEVLTHSPEGECHMDDEARCPECGKTGITNHDDDEAWVNWNEH